MSAIFLLFFSTVTFALSSIHIPLLRPSFYLKLSGISGRKCLLSTPLLLGYNGSLDTHFFRATTRLMSWPGGVRYSCLLQSLVVFLLNSYIHSSLFLDWQRKVSFKFVAIQVSSVSAEKFMLSRHPRCILSRLCCNQHSMLLNSYLSRICTIQNPSCSACGHPIQNTSHLILHCPATDSLSRLLFGDCVFLRPLP